MFGVANSHFSQSITLYLPPEITLSSRTRDLSDVPVQNCLENLRCLDMKTADLNMVIDLTAEAQCPILPDQPLSATYGQAPQTTSRPGYNSPTASIGENAFHINSFMGHTGAAIKSENQAPLFYHSTEFQDTQSMKQMLIPDFIFLTDQDDEVASITINPMATECIRTFASPADEERVDELLSIFLQSPFPSAPTPPLSWLEACLDPSTDPAIALTEQSALPPKFVHVRRSAKKRVRVGFIDFTKDCNLKLRLDELYMKDPTTQKEKKELDDLEAILGCHSGSRSRKERRRKSIRKNGRANNQSILVRTT